MSQTNSHKIFKASLLILPMVLLFLFFAPNTLFAQETSPAVSITEEPQPAGEENPQEDKSLNLKEEETECRRENVQQT